MKKKGAGWIPDYPDIKDYTLGSGEIQNLANQVQSQGATASIETLAQGISEVLVQFLNNQVQKNQEDNDKLNNLLQKIIEIQFLNDEKSRPMLLDIHQNIYDFQIQKKEEANNPLTQLQENLEEKISGELGFVKVELHSVIQPGMAESEVLLMKNYLQRIVSTWNIFKPEIDYQPDITNTIFDPKTQETVENILKTQGYLQVDGVVGKDDMEALAQLAHGIDLTPGKPFFDLVEKIANKYDIEDISKYQEQKNTFAKNPKQSFQGLLTFCLLPCIDFLNNIYNKGTESKLKGTEIYILALEEYVKIIENNKNMIAKIFGTLHQQDTDNNELINVANYMSRTEAFDEHIINPINELVQQFYKVVSEESEDAYLKYLASIREKLWNFKSMAESLYRLYPPEIPSEIFEKKEIPISPPIPDVLVELFKIELDNHSEKIKLKLSDKGNEISLLKQPIDSHKDNSVIEVLAQILMPLGQYSSLNEAVEQGIEKILGLGEGEVKQDNYPDIRGLKPLKPIKKPLFEITKKKTINENSSAENTSSNKSKTSLQQKNILQFPLSSKLRQQIKAVKNQTSSDESIFLSLPEFVDLTYWCSPVEDQGTLNSCTAHAGVALMEYAQKKSSDNYIDASPLFLYRVTRNLMQREGDSGASVRDTMKAMVAFGVCPEEHWPYEEDKFDQEPTAFCYSFAENYKTIKYFRLDYGQISRYSLLCQVKVLLASEIPCIFGFTLYNSVYDEVNFRRGHIPLPNKRSKVIGGHTVVAVGYHDRKIIENENGKPSKGALLIRNSWGTRWGQGGYGWLPYDYIMQGLTADWWSLLKAEWLATGRFGAGASAWNADKGDGGGDKRPGQP